jgi:transcriptional regulator with XRE-family HTH domain
MDNNTSLIGLGRAIRELREEERVDEDDLAAAADITVEKLRALEAGKFDPDYDLMIALARGLGGRPSTIILRAESLTAELKPPG